MSRGPIDRVRVTGAVPPDGWRLVLTAPADVDVMSYVRTPGGFLTSMHDVLPFEAGLVDFSYRAAFFNPASNGDQVSVLYAANPNEHGISLYVYGFDDANDSDRKRVTSLESWVRRAW